MKKALTFLLFLSACKPEPTLKGQEFVLRQPDMEITLAFDLHENRYFGKAVNNYFGTYQMQGDKISFGSTASTMMMGPEEDMELEARYFDDLSQVQNYTLTPDTLTLTLGSGTVLVFDKISGKNF
jgi:heat shock protein HslJ